MRNVVSGVLMAVLALLIAHGASDAATIHVQGPAASIQEALDNAADGDTVMVGAGSYAENIVIRKTVKLVAEAGPSQTTVTAVSTDRPVIKIDGAPDVTVSGFTVTGTEMSGIIVTRAHGAVITDNRSVHNGYGITVYESSGNTLTGNTASNNRDYGFFLQRSNENILEDNTANSNNDKGFFISYSSRNKIINNNANLNVWNGITIWASNDNLVKDNLTLRNAFGIVLEDSRGNELIDNTTLPNIFIILPIFLIYIGILTYMVQKQIVRLIYRS